jgi:metal-responsive CopG/Arc/MetJ family transcriptional regulator
MKGVKNAVITGFSLSKELLEQIEFERGDISRSKFLRKLIERGLSDAKK